MANSTTTSKPKVLIPEKVSADGISLLQETLDVHEKKGLAPADLLSIIGDYDALIVRSETKVNEELLRAAKKLKVVARAGVGVDNVDVKTATALGVIVVNSPTGNINAAAEHTVALMMATARNIGEASASIKQSKWERSKFVGVELKGKTLAIVGAGKVGLTVARIANGFGMHVIAYDPYANPALCEAASVTLKNSLDELLMAADFFTIHTPLIASTKGMISTDELAKMKPTARILNVARGGTIDESALLTALNNNTLGGAGIDVFTSEPPAADSPASALISHPKVVATPHLGASTIEAQENVSLDVCEQVISILSGALPRSAVNAPLILPSEFATLQPFVTLVERMGSLYTQHYSRAHGGDFRTTFDLTYEGELAALGTTKPLFAALVKGLVAPTGGRSVNVVNAEIVAKERGLLINELRSREHVSEEGFTSFVTLRARSGRDRSAARGAKAGGSGSGRASGAETPGADGPPQHAYTPHEQVLQGYVSHNTPFISRLGRFRANFIPAGTLLICRNFDDCGRIGYVGRVLGAAGVNIRFMSVAPLELGQRTMAGSGEALMILGVDREVDEKTRKGLIGKEGVLDASVVSLS